jgi:MoaA/NifB/PqqE/SkfB family radical SAM enzyme
MAVDPKKELSTHDYRIAAPKVAKLGVRFVSLTGGEPFLRHDLHEIVGILSKYFFVFITSNGVSITRKMARNVAKSGVSSVFLSLDFITPEKHDVQRGVSGTYEHVINSLHVLREELHPTQIVGIMTVLSSQNVDEIEDLLRLAEKLKVKIHIHPYTPVKTGDMSFRLHDDITPVVTKIRRFKANHGVVVSSYPFLDRFDKYLKTGVPNCQAGISFFNIDSYGNIQRCVEDYPNGPILANVKVDTYKHINQALEKLPPNPCTQCWYSYRGEMKTVYSRPIRRGVDIMRHLYSSISNFSEVPQESD